MKSVPLKANLGLERASTAYKARVKAYMWYRVKAIKQTFRPLCRSYGQTYATAAGAAGESVTIPNTLAILYTKNVTENLTHTELFQHPRTHILTNNSGKATYFKCRPTIGGLHMGEDTEVKTSFRSPWIETANLDADWGIVHLGVGQDIPHATNVFPNYMLDTLYYIQVKGNNPL